MAINQVEDIFIAIKLEGQDWSCSLNAVQLKREATEGDSQVNRKKSWHNQTMSVLL